MATQSFLRILQLLEGHGVEYLVVGGVAAVLQGAPVTTFDIDALVKVDDANADRLLAALQALEARYREHGALRPTRDDLLAGGHLLLMTNSGPLDILGFIGQGKRYEDFADAVSTIAVGDLSVRVLGIDALIEEKGARAGQGPGRRQAPRSSAETTRLARRRAARGAFAPARIRCKAQPSVPQAERLVSRPGRTGLRRPPDHWLGAARGWHGAC